MRSLLKNIPLLQRVRRHTSMAVLYMAVDEGSSLSVTTGSKTSSGTPVVKANLITPRSAMPTGMQLAAGDVDDALPPAAIPSTPTSPVQRRPAQPTSEGPSGQPAPSQKPSDESGQDTDFDWIGDDEWTDLKSFMAGHQEQLVSSHESGDASPVQRSADESARQETESRKREEIARRQALAREGRLPRAKVTYVSEEEPASPVKDQPSPVQASSEPSQQKDETSAVSEEKPAGPTTQEQDARTVAAPVPAGETKGAEIEVDNTITTPTETGPTSSTTPPTIHREEAVEEPANEMETNVQPPAIQNELDDKTGSERITSKPSTQSDHPPIEEPTAEPPAVSSGEPEATVSKAEVTPASVQRTMAPESSSKPAIAPDQSPPPEKTSGLGYRLVAAARSLLGRDEESPAIAMEESSSDVAGEAPVAEPVAEEELMIDEAPAIESTEMAGPAIVQRSPSVETVIDESAEITDESTSPKSQIQKSVETPTPTTGDAPTVPADPINIPEQVESTPVETTVSALGSAPDGSPDGEPETVIEIPEGRAEAPESPAIKLSEDAETTVVIEKQRTGEEPLAAAQPEPATDQIEPSIEPIEPSVDRPESPEATETGPQPVSLDQVWPVKKVEPPKAPRLPILQKKSGLSKPLVQRKPAGEDAIADELHMALKDVSPAEATDSSIELVTPRRPRPALRPKPEPTPEAQRLAPEISRESVKEQPPLAAEDPRMVPTEIGDLPSDLWELLGEKPPTDSQERGVQFTRGQGPESVQRSEGEIKPPIDHDDVPAQPALQEMLFPTVQRTDRSLGRGSAREPEAVVEEEAESGEAEQSEVDVDELARQVLPEIKRRLSLEWERGRGRI